jgi:hypothetical protein
MRSLCAMKTTATPVPLVGNASPAADVHATSALGLNNPRVAKAWIYSSVTTDDSHMVADTSTCAGSIFSSSTPVDLALNTPLVSSFACESAQCGGPKNGGATNLAGAVERQHNPKYGS